jgi:hypothetical protein
VLSIQMGVMPIITSPRRSYDFVLCGAGIDFAPPLPACSPRCVTA